MLSGAMYYFHCVHRIWSHGELNYTHCCSLSSNCGCRNMIRRYAESSAEAVAVDQQVVESITECSPSHRADCSNCTSGRGFSGSAAGCGSGECSPTASPGSPLDSDDPVDDAVVVDAMCSGDILTTGMDRLRATTDSGTPRVRDARTNSTSGMAEAAQSRDLNKVCSHKYSVHG